MPVTLPAVGSFNWGDIVNNAITALSLGFDTQHLLRTASGSVSVNLVAAASAVQAVTYPAGRFTSTPIVVATCASGSSAYVAGVGSMTVNGFNAIIFHRAGTATTNTLTCNWIAIATS